MPRREAKAENAVGALCTGLLAIGEARGVSWTDDEKRRVAACEDPATLQRWLLRVASASSASSVLD